MVTLAVVVSASNTNVLDTFNVLVGMVIVVEAIYFRRQLTGWETVIVLVADPVMVSVMVLVMVVRVVVDVHGGSVVVLVLVFVFFFVTLCIEVVRDAGRVEYDVLMVVVL